MWSCLVSRCCDAQESKTTEQRFHVVTLSGNSLVLRDFFQQQLYLWLIQKKGFFPNIRSFRHRISSSFRSKFDPQPDDTSSLINNCLKCATIYDCYEYGLEIQANRSQTSTEATCELVSLPANHKAPIKKEVVRLCMQAKRIFFVTPVFLFWILFS